MVSLHCVSGDDAVTVDIQSRKITESSGLAASNRLTGHFWTHNDSGAGPKLYAINEQGAVTGSVALDDAKAIDWEDIASFVDNKTQRLIVADVGDNQAKRETVTLYLLNEPDPLVHGRLKSFQTITVRYPDGPHDCEAIGVDVKHQLIWMVAKSLLPIAPVYSLALAELNGDESKSVTMVRRGTLAAPLISAMDIDPRTGDILLVNYFQCLRFNAQKNDTAGAWIARVPQVIVLPKLKQIEAVAVDAQGDIWVTSEGSPGKLSRLHLKELREQELTK